MTFDPSKPVAANHGRPARILASDLNNRRPIAAAHIGTDGKEYILHHRIDGTCPQYSTEYDLHNVPEWVVMAKHVKLSRDGFVIFDPSVAELNVCFTFEGGKLVAVELIGDE